MTQRITKPARRGLVTCRAASPDWRGPVELGKEIANQIAPQRCTADDPDLDHDSSTHALIRQYRSLKRR